MNTNLIAEQIACRGVPYEEKTVLVYDREKAAKEITEVLIGDLTDQLSKQPYSNLDDKEFSALLTRVAEKLSFEINNAQ
tara:strand:+ start:1407 stop:1643 length:237 start_codon:yes stop_codon:yes gene_type:complete